MVAAPAVPPWNSNPAIAPSFFGLASQVKDVWLPAVAPK